MQASEPGDRAPQRVAPPTKAADPTDPTDPTSAADAPSARERVAPGASIVELARARLGRELRSLPPWGSAALQARLFAPSSPTPGVGASGGVGGVGGAPGVAASQASPSVSLGALVHAIRRARRAGATPTTADLFVALLGRIEGTCAQWARRIVASIPVGGADALTMREDLRQELTLRLWERVGRGDSEVWELYFQRALVFEQRHVATTFLARLGYRRDPLSQAPSRGVAVLLSRLTGAVTTADERARSPDLPSLVGFGARESDGPTAPAEIADGRDHFTAADLADLRWLVARLPDRERLAVTLRFWYGATEIEIGQALGGVTTRTVRNLLSRAYGRLRSDYQPDQSATTVQRADDVERHDQDHNHAGEHAR